MGVLFQSLRPYLELEYANRWGAISARGQYRLDCFGFVGCFLENQISIRVKWDPYSLLPLMVPHRIVKVLIAQTIEFRL